MIAPRGWNCFATYGSGGEGVLVSRPPIGRSGGGDLVGSAVAFSHTFGGTSGELHYGPHPGDRLTYKTREMIEYETPAQTDGLGTHSGMLTKNASPIRGVAILLPGEQPDSLLLAIRLPSGMTDLAPIIIQQVERDARKLR